MKVNIRRVTKVSFLMFSVMLLLSSCVKEEVYHVGPRGYDGEAFFGIDYSVVSPYSYTDNNPSIPNNPILGEYYSSSAGRYNFEYFVNPYEYWYGSYELWINYGGAGGDFGEPGLDGTDTFLMLICNPQGFYEERTLGRSMEVFAQEGDAGQVHYRIKMKKAHINVRSPQFQSDQY